jgi:hypothetical protein
VTQRLGGLLTAALVAGSTAMSAHAGSYRAPHTRDGAPDLQGVWSNASLTKMQRPEAFKTLVVGASEAAPFERKHGDKKQRASTPIAPDAPAPPVTDAVGQDAEDQFFTPSAELARIGGQIRTSWIVEPRDGQLPFTDAARAEAKAAEFGDDNVFDNPETRPFDERCILGVGGSAGPPFVNPGENAQLQILQTRDYVTILAEMNHDVRIIPLRDRKHGPAGIKPWMGDSIGWWEGNTLVVETVNFNPGERWHWNNGDYVLIGVGAKVTERFTRTGRDSILYRFAVDDRTNYTQTWSGEMPLSRSGGPIYEYACHEGNYALPGILAGARKAESVPPAKP